METLRRINGNLISDVYKREPEIVAGDEGMFSRPSKVEEILRPDIQFDIRSEERATAEGMPEPKVASRD